MWWWLHAYKDSVTKLLGMLGMLSKEPFPLSHAVAFNKIYILLWLDMLDNV